MIASSLAKPLLGASYVLTYDVNLLMRLVRACCWAGFSWRKFLMRWSSLVVSSDDFSIGCVDFW